jgi:predicted phosphodiesterase
LLEDNIKWSQHPTILNRLLELDAARYTQPEMAQMIRDEFPMEIVRVPTRDQIKNALAFARNKAEYLRERPRAQIMPYFDRHRDAIEGVIEVEKDYALLSSILEKPKRKILILSDLHVPFTNESKLQKAIDLNRTADMVVIGGDFLDMYGCSRHRKRKSVPHEVEIDTGVRVLEYLSETFPWVTIIRGNHDSRAMKKVQDAVDPSLLYLFDTEPLDLMVRPFSNVQYVGNWWTQIGDALIAHAERSSTVEGRPGILLGNYFQEKGWAKRLNLPPIRVFVQAHTHQVSAVYREDTKYFECGALVDDQSTGAEYVTDSTAFMRPPLHGCVLLTQFSGKTDFNLSREYVL